MKKILLFVLAVLTGGTLFAPDPVDAADCPLGWSQKVSRKGGASGPSSCLMPTCRAASASAHGHATKYAPDPLCNPVLGPCDWYLVWHYDYVLSGSPTVSCPSDVVNASWSTKSN